MIVRGWDPANDTAIRDVARSQGLGRDLRAVADPQVISDGDLSAQYHVVSKRTRTPDAALSDDDAILTDLDVVADLNEVVDFCAATDACHAAACPVNGTVGTDLDVVFDDDASDLRDLAMPAVALKVAETIRSNCGIGMNDNPITDSDALPDDDIRPQHAIKSDGYPGSNIHTRINLCAGADRSAGSYMNMGANCRAVDDSVRTDDRCRVDAGRNAVGWRRQIFEYLANCHVGVSYTYHRAVRRQRTAFRHQ